MKRKCLRLIYLLLLFSYSSIYGQSSFDFYDYVKNQDRYYDSIFSVTPDSVKVPGWRQYQRWKDFWLNRTHNDNVTRGSLSEYSSKLISAANDLATDVPLNEQFRWELQGPLTLKSHNKGILVSLWVDPTNPNIILTGSNTAGMFRTVDGGLNWINVTDNIGIPAVGINDIAVDPNNNDIIYIAASVNRHEYISMNQPAYIFKTTDNCQTWTQVLYFPASNNFKANRVVIDPDSSNYVYALIKGHVFRSSDAGINWISVFNNLSYVPDNYWNNNKHLQDIEFKPGDPNTIYISSDGINDPEYSDILNSEVWFTTNARSSTPTWTRITVGLPAFTDRIELAVTSQNPNLVYAVHNIMTSSSTGTIYVKSLNGLAFQTVFSRNMYYSYGSDFGGFGYWRAVVAISPINPNIIYIGGFNLNGIDISTNIITDSYKVSSAPNASFHVDQRNFKVVNNGDLYIYCANDGGLSKYNCSNKSMSSINGLGLDNLQYYGIGHSPQLGDFYIGGCQDNGIIGNGNNSWDVSMVGDGYDVVIDPISPNIVYALGNGGSKSVLRSTNYGKTFTGFNTGLNNNHGLNDRPLQFSKVDNTTLYIGTNNVFKRVKGSSAWVAISSFETMQGRMPGKDISALGLTAANEGTIYAAFALPTWDPNGSKASLYVTHDGGVHWIDISDNIIDECAWAGITDIHVSPEDPNKVWISFGGYWGNNGISDNRVLYSTNGGSTFTDISFNLPELPVLCMAGVDINLRHKLLIGNDLGVFMYDEINQTWENAGLGLPLAPIYDIEVNQEQRKILVATYGRSIWSSEIPCDIENETIEVTNQRTLYSDYIIHGNIKLKSSSSLTVKGKLSLSRDSKVIIERGAQLIVDGGILTSSCETTWQGIDVWGNSNLPQMPTTNQGLIRVTNGGVIENAVTAIRTWRPEPLPDGVESTTPDREYYGGIVMLDNAILKNNKVAIDFLPYSFRNYSIIKNSIFETNKALNGGLIPDYFIKMNGVNGITISGTEFKNTFTGNSILTNRGGGIYAYNSDIIVDQSCIGETLPCNEFTRSSFFGLYYGINGLCTDVQRIVKIQNSDISNTVRGTYISNMDFAKINLNHFYPWDEAVGINPEGYGLYLDASTAFTIEENRFVNLGTTRKGIGLIINEAGIENNEIYNNYFERLNYATIAQGYNRNNSIGGLCYKCNDFAYNDYDITVVPRNPRFISSFDGIAQYQGKNVVNDNLAPAGNTFTSTTNVYDINNNAGWITYYRHQYGPTGIIHPTPTKGTTVTLVGNTTYNKLTSCPSHLGTGTSKEELKESLTYSNLQVETLEETLALTLDNGNTNNLQTEIITSQPSEGLELRNQLIEVSPYLSDTILKTAIQEDAVLNNAMIRDVLVANPQSAKSIEMIEMLDDRIEPLTDEMKNEVLIGQTISGQKENLEANIQYWKKEAWYNFAELCRTYAYDSSSTWNSDSVRYYYEQQPSLEARYKVVFWYWSNRLVSQAQQVLNTIPSQFQLNTYQNLIHTANVDLLNYLISLSSASAPELNQESDLYESLLQLSVLTEDKPSAASRNLLRAKGLITYQEPIKLEDEYKTIQAFEPNRKEEISNIFNVFPNPATTFVTVSWNYLEESNLKMNIVSSSGIVQKSLTLEGKNNQKIIDLSDLNPGNYSFIFFDGKEKVESVKVSVIK